MLEALKIRLAARCEAAGRPENEDNFQVAENLAVSNTGFTTDKVFTLGTKGTLLLVCDGMGGMNAGEVASAVGVETIKNLYAPQFLTNEVLANDESICSYMKHAIIKADSRIKEEASKDAAKQGMGSTAVMAWLLGNKVYVAWCGDSRCYRYNPASGLEQLSHDHSYVQDLVDSGQLDENLAFDHPNKNIITRSLGDPRGAAKPDAKVYNLQKGDVIMLCSDGLSDSLRDSEIEQSIGRSVASMEACRDALWNDSKKAGWHDNVTVVLAQVIDEKAEQANYKKEGNSQILPQQPHTIQREQEYQVTSKKQRKAKKLFFNWKVILIFFIIFGACICGIIYAPIIKCQVYINNHMEDIKNDIELKETEKIYNNLITLKPYEKKYNKLRPEVLKRLKELETKFEPEMVGYNKQKHETLKSYIEQLDRKE